MKNEARNRVSSPVGAADDKTLLDERHDESAWPRHTLVVLQCFCKLRRGAVKIQWVEEPTLCFLGAASDQEAVAGRELIGGKGCQWVVVETGFLVHGLSPSHSGALP